MEQLSLFENDLLKIDKPIRLIELFAGYGSQALALKYLGADFESWRICEWAVKSIIAYKDLHAGDDDEDYSAGMTEAEVKAELLRLGVSNDYCSPMTEAQMKRMPEARARQVYNAIRATRNLVDVCKVRPEDLDMRDGDEYCYVMTYSFPCQDLSTGGLQKGMAKGSGTRSGLLWEVERILTECEESGTHMPDVLLMENVGAILQEKNREDFVAWIRRLEELGYASDYKLLNAKNFDVPQNRPRVFMVSNREGRHYRFDEGTETKRRLGDILSPGPYKYLTARRVEMLEAHARRHAWKGNGYGWKPAEAGDLAMTLETNSEHGTMQFLIEGANGGGMAWKPSTREKISSCVMTNDTRGDVTYFVEEREGRVKPGKNKRIEIDGDDIYVNGTKARIRYFTGLELFRLMGVRDEDYYKIAKNQSPASLVHLAGDSIVVNVLMSVFGRMLGDEIKQNEGGNEDDEERA